MNIPFSDDSDPSLELYNSALALLEKDSFEDVLSGESCAIPYRSIRTEFVGCDSDAEFLAKLHCLRIAFKDIMDDDDDRQW